MLLFLSILSFGSDSCFTFFTTQANASPCSQLRPQPRRQTQPRKPNSGIPCTKLHGMNLAVPTNCHCPTTVLMIARTIRANSSAAHQHTAARCLEAVSFDFHGASCTTIKKHGLDSIAIIYHARISHLNSPHCMIVVCLHRIWCGHGRMHRRA